MPQRESGCFFSAVGAGPRADEKPPAPAAGAALSYPVLEGLSEVVTASKAGDAVWVYSTQTGHWHKQAIPADQGPIRPLVGNGVVLVRTRTMLYACSPQTGAWDSIELGEVRDARGDLILHGRNMVALQAGKKLYGFSSETGNWDSVELGKDEAGTLDVGARGALLEAGSKLYAFSPKAGKWAMVDRDKP